MRRKLLWTVIALLTVAALLLYIRCGLPFIPQHGKGGVGIAGRGAFVFTNDGVNSMKCADTVWRGRAWQFEETVICRAGGVAPFQLSMLRERPLIIAFRSNRIYIFDAAAFSGGYYLRDHDQDGAEKDLRL